MFAWHERCLVWCCAFHGSAGFDDEPMETTQLEETLEQPDPAMDTKLSGTALKGPSKVKREDQMRDLKCLLAAVTSPVARHRYQLETTDAQVRSSRCGFLSCVTVGNDDGTRELAVRSRTQ